MLRMYQCQWCFSNLVKDDGDVKKVQAGDRMSYNLRSVCIHCERIRNMKAMVRDGNDDWVYEGTISDNSRKEVTPRIMCAMEIG